ncbi:MAG TPA: ScyD/ScyE family protein [Acidobacteriota bacterium]|nr:ScyD/ScyE family protein [Acidobacteriota bacterium]
MIRHKFRLLLLLLLTLCGGPLCHLIAQCQVSAVTAGLRAPVKIVFSGSDHLIVTEAGNGPNTGRISVVDVTSGIRRTLVEGLPSGFSPPDNAPSGPSGIALRGRTLYLAIGNGDVTVAGAVPGTDVPNPIPSSPIFSSVLALHFSNYVEDSTAGFALTLEDHEALSERSQLKLDNGMGDKLTIRLIADFQDWVADPRPGEPNAVRHSNPFGLAVLDDELYLNDASMNSIRVIQLTTGDSETLTTLPPLPNTRPFGPPLVEPVPDSIRALSSQELLVTLLSGFPFPPGQARVLQVDRETGAAEALITGLTSAIDVLPYRSFGNEMSYLTLEFSADMLVPGTPGRLRLFSPGSSPVDLSTCLITPTSMARDQQSGDIYVSEIFTGRIVRVVP